MQDEVNRTTQGVKTTLIPSYRAQIEGLSGDLSELTGELAALEAEHTRAMNKMIYDMMTARLATDGWTSEETELAFEIARSMGLIDEATWQTATSMNAALDAFAQGAGVEATQQAIYGILHDLSSLSGGVGLSTGLFAGLSATPIPGGMHDFGALQPVYGGGYAQAAPLPAPASVAGPSIITVGPNYIYGPADEEVFFANVERRLKRVLRG